MQKIILGLIGAVAILFVEMVLYIIRASYADTYSNPGTRTVLQPENPAIKVDTSYSTKPVTFRPPREDDDIDFSILATEDINLIGKKNN